MAFKIAIAEKSAQALENISHLPSPKAMQIARTSLT